MPWETVTIELTKLKPYEAAARILAVIAYPYEASECEHFADAILVWFLRKRALTFNDWARVPYPIEPRLFTVEDVEGGLKRGLKILNRRRWIAARQAAPRFDWFWEYATTGHKPKWQPVAPTSEAMIDAISLDLEEPRRRETRGRKAGKGAVVAKSNEIRLAWTPSRPVLHLCWAFHRAIPGDGVNLGDFLENINAKEVLRIIAEAQAVAHLLRGEFQIADSEWISVVPASGIN